MVNTIIILTLFYIALSVTPFNKKHIVNKYRGYILFLIGIILTILILIYFTNLVIEVVTMIIINLF